MFDLVIRSDKVVTPAGVASCDLAIQGEKIVVTQDKSGLKHGTASGQPASFRQKRQGVDEFVEGYADRIEYDSKSETVDFFGQARMQRGQDEIRGDHITYNSRTEIFQALGAAVRDDGQKGAVGNGRVRVIIQPKNKSTPVVPTEEPLSIQPAPTLTQPEGNQ